VSEDELDALIAWADVAGGGRLSLRAFQGLVSNCDAQVASLMHVLQAFSQTPYGMPDLHSTFRNIDTVQGDAIQKDMVQGKRVTGGTI
jgi:hypothetical protein